MKRTVSVSCLSLFRSLCGGDSYKTVLNYHIAMSKPKGDPISFSNESTIYQTVDFIYML